MIHQKDGGQIGKIISHNPVFKDPVKWDNILEKLGEEAMRAVFGDVDTKLKRTAAQKFVPNELTRAPEAKEHFNQETQAASTLDHPKICTMHEIDETKPALLNANSPELIDAKKTRKAVITKITNWSINYRTKKS